MSANIQIRNMVIEDYEQVLELWVKTDGVGVRDADSKQGIEYYLARNPNLSFVATSEEKIIGSIMAGHDGRRGSLQHLVVSTEFRGLHIGKHLVDTALSALKNVGILKTHIHVFKTNTKGQAFWDNLGWTERSDLKTYSFINSENKNI